MHTTYQSVTVLMTVKNDPDGCETTLQSLDNQTRAPDEIVIVDGGSTDDTVDVIRSFAASNPRIRLIEAPGANIARGRNIGTLAATCKIIATTDSGCRAEPQWLEKLVQPFEENPDTEFVAGFYQIETHSLLEKVVGLATMRGQLDPVNPDSFNPSARSLALTKDLWMRAGGWPEWIYYSEDTLFDHKVRRMNAVWQFAGDAIVHWRPRSSLRSIARQFFNYGTGRGHTRIDAASFMYNLRNVLLVLSAGAASVLTWWAVPLLIVMLGYFYVWTFHEKSLRIARRVQEWHAYPLSMIVIWIVMFSNLTGFLVGSWQRWRNRERFHTKIEAYLAGVS